MPYVDLHCHILPGLDDGARSLDRRRCASPAGSTARTCSMSRPRRTSSARTSRLDIRELARLRATSSSARSAPRACASRCTRAASSPTRTRSRSHDRELAADRPGPGARAVAPARVPVRRPRRRLRRRRRAPDRASATACCSRTRSAPTATWTPARARTPRHGALLQVNVSSLLGSPRPGRAADRGASSCRRPRVLPGRRTRTPASREAIAPARRRRAAPARRQRRPGLPPHAVQSALPAA